MSTRRIGSTQQYAEGWDRAFGKGTKTAKKATPAKKKSSGSTSQTARSTKKTAKKKAARRGK